eukprot:6115323-Alexandrium_andersonii.AAC.1
MARALKRAHDKGTSGKYLIASLNNVLTQAMAGHIKAEVAQAQGTPEEPAAPRLSLFTDTEAEKKEAPPPRPKPPPREAQPSSADARDWRLDEAAW